MTKSKSTVALLILALAAAGLQCGGRRRAADAGAQSTVAVKSKNFKRALDMARQSEPDDQLGRVADVVGKVRLSGKRLDSLDELRVLGDGALVALDAERQAVEMFDGSGEFRRDIGAKGGRPGNYNWPSGVAEAAGGDIAVSDFQAHRVNLFSKDGAFSRSFIYTAQQYSAQRILYDGPTKSFYLFGNRWQHDGENRVTGADLVHKYNEAGEYVASYLPFPGWAKGLDLYGHDSPALDVQGGDLYVALPFEYKVYKLTPRGELTCLLEGAQPEFKAPETGIVWREGSGNSERLLHWQDWRLTWTPIVGLVVDGDRMLVQYQTFNPARYTLDVWSLAGARKLASATTNRLLLSKGPDGSVYFLSNLDTKGQDEYEVLRARLKEL